MNLTDRLAQLESAQLVRSAGKSDLAYVFKHLLIQETAYGTLLVKSRRAIHRQVARTYEQLHADHLDEYAPELARHYAEAGDDPTATLKYARMAGDAAFHRYANAEAVRHYSLALAAAQDLAEIDGMSLTELYTRRGRALEMSGQYDAALANYEEMAALAKRRGDSRMELAALIAEATARSTPTPVLDAAQAQVLSERALELADQLADRGAVAKILWNLSLLNYFSGQPEQAAIFGERSIAIAREMNLSEQLAYLLNDVQRSYLALGQIERARTALAEAETLWRKLDNQPMLADSLIGTAETYIATGDYDQALALLDDAERINRTIGNLWGQAYHRVNRSWIYLERGHVDDALADMDESIRLGRLAGFVLPILVVPLILALSYVTLGDTQRGLAMGQRALSAAGSLPQRWRPFAMAILAQIHLAADDLAAAQAVIPETLEDMVMDAAKVSLRSYMVAQTWLANAELRIREGDRQGAIELMDALLDGLRRFNIRPNRSDALYLKGRALLAQGHVTRAQDAIQAARVEAESLGSRRILWEILLTLSQLATRGGDRAEADAMLRQAREIVEYIARHIGSDELRSSFLNQARVRAIFQPSKEDIQRTDFLAS